MIIIMPDNHHQVCQIAARFQDEGDERQVNFPFLPLCKTSSSIEFDKGILCSDNCSQMTDELRQAFRLYDKEQHGYISTLVLKVTRSFQTNTSIIIISGDHN